MRTIGLHTAFVGPARPLVYGLLTRKDVTAENAEACLGAKAAAARRAARGRGGQVEGEEEEAADTLAAVGEGDGGQQERGKGMPEAALPPPADGVKA